jgi:tetratricopeptide (TPR) repeat protein
LLVLGACHDDPPVKLSLDRPAIAPKAAATPEQAAEPPPLAADTDEQRSLIESAKRALAAGDPAAATEAFELLRRSEPMSGSKLTGVIALADVYLGQNDPKRALAIIAEAAEQVPPTAELAFVDGRAQKAAGDPRRAIVAFQTALALQPLLIHAHVELGGLYASIGDNERSAQAFLAYERGVYNFSKMLEDPEIHPDDKLKIIDAFGFVPDDRATLALLVALDDPDRPVRLAAAQELAEVGTRAALPKLEIARDTALSLGDKELGAAIDASITKIGESPEEPTVDTDGNAGVGPTFIKDGSEPDAGARASDGGAAGANRDSDATALAPPRLPY